MQRQVIPLSTATPIASISQETCLHGICRPRGSSLGLSRAVARLGAALRVFHPPAHRGHRAGRHFCRVEWRRRQRRRARTEQSRAEPSQYFDLRPTGGGVSCPVDRLCHCGTIQKSPDAAARLPCRNTAATQPTILPYFSSPSRFPLCHPTQDHARVSALPSSAPAFCLPCCLPKPFRRLTSVTNRCSNCLTEFHLLCASRFALHACWREFEPAN